MNLDTSIEEQHNGIKNETAQVIKAVQSVIGYTDLHPSVKARLDRVYERLDE
jgi:hypothetical protein